MSRTNSAPMLFAYSSNQLRVDARGPSTRTSLQKDSRSDFGDLSTYDEGSRAFYSGTIRRDKSVHAITDRTWWAAAKSLFIACVVPTSAVLIVVVLWLIASKHM